MNITPILLQRIAPINHGARKSSQDTIISGVATTLNTLMESSGINTPLRVAHFLAQVCEESDGFVTAEEYATGVEYEGRTDLGNSEPGDGAKFKGRGLIQITGRYNYMKYGQLLKLPLIATPTAASIPACAARIAVSFWTQHGLNTFADSDDIESITKRVNGGLNGLLIRQGYLAQAKLALGYQEATPVV